MTRLNTSVIAEPWNVSVVSNDTHSLQTLLAPAWVGSPNVRGSMDILRSCILTLVACIYTALHLDVPKKATWHYVLFEKVKWASVTLFAPEISVYTAAVQLKQAWSLKSALRKIQKQKQSSNWTAEADFEINLEYAFFIVMGAVRFDVHDILSFSDLDESARKLFQHSSTRRNSVRPSPTLIRMLAERDQWVKVRKEDIDDKSKADVIQKTFVVIQVTWMVMQCIARLTSDLPLSLLEIHTIVHVVCAILLYSFWFKKPLNIQEAMIIKRKEIEGELGMKLQKQFYSDMSYKLALFPPRQQVDQEPPTDVDGKLMKWIEPEPQALMKVGDVLPSGLTLYSADIKRYYYNNDWRYRIDRNDDPGEFSFLLTKKFLRRWDAILTASAFDNRETLAVQVKKLDFEHIQRAPLLETNNSYLLENNQALFLARLQEFDEGRLSDQQRPFWEGRSIFHIETPEIKEWGYDKYKMHSSAWKLWELPWVILLGTTLSALYGGVHLAAWKWAFPSYGEEIAWKFSCVLIASALPFYFLVPSVTRSVVPRLLHRFDVDIADDIFSWLILSVIELLLYLVAIGYILSRVFIIAESFASLRYSPVGVFVTFEWVELFPHF